MTTIKPGSVNQGPLYGCTCCYELQSFPASDLRVHDNECWCYWCWGEYKEAESGIEYADLPAFEPQPAPDVAALVEALEAALMVMTSREVRLEKQADAIAMARAALADYREGGDV